jgi:hypothetical protein
MDLNGGIADMLEASRGGGRGGRVVRDHCFGYLDMPNVRKPLSGSFTISSRGQVARHVGCFVEHRSALLR